MTGLILDLLLTGLVATAQTPPRQHLVVASQLNNPPYEYLDEQGVPAGYVNDLIRAVAAQEGLTLEIRPLAWSEVRAAFDRGQVDAVTGMVFSEERAKVMDFTIPHSYVPYVLITRKGDLRIRSERDLAGMEVLVLGRSIMSEHLEAMGIPYRQTGTHEESVLELASGRADAALVPKYNYLYFTQKRGIRNLQALASEVYPTKRGFAVRKGDAALLARLNEGLFLVKQNGQMDAIYGRHLGALEAAEVPVSMLLSRSWRVLAPVGLGLGLVGVLIWSITLKRLVERRTAHLLAAMAEVRQLSGLIPICAHCKKIRDDAGYWQAVEGYISEHSEARFSHGLCPECVRLDFPEFAEAAHSRKESLENGSGS
jgi:polar amino acid transport system substrate-binding protein